MNSFFVLSDVVVICEAIVFELFRIEGYFRDAFEIRKAATFLYILYLVVLVSEEFLEYLVFWDEFGFN